MQAPLPSLYESLHWSDRETLWNARFSAFPRAFMILIFLLYQPHQSPFTMLIRNTKSGHISRTSGTDTGWCHCLGPGRSLSARSVILNESIITIKWFLWSHIQQTIQMFALAGNQDSGFAVVCCFAMLNMQGVHEASTSAKLLSSPCDYVQCTSHRRTTSFGPNPKLMVSSCHYIMRNRWLQVFQQHS